jgi:Zn-dependent protease with chaperone function
MFFLVVFFLIPLIAALGAWINAQFIYRLCAKRIREAAKVEWPEDARLLWPFFGSVSWAPELFSRVLMAPLLVYAVVEPNGLVWPVLIGWLAAWYAGFFPLYFRAEKLWKFERRFPLWPEVGEGVLLYSGYIVIAGVMLTMQEPEWSWRTAAVVAGGLVAFAGWNSTVATWKDILKKRHLPVPERLREIVSTAAGDLNVPVPGILMIALNQPHAEAYPAAHMIGFTPSLVELLDDAELAWVARHEIAHLTEPVPATALRHLRVAVYLPLFLLRPLAASLEPFWAAVIAIGWIQLGSRAWADFSRNLERRADANAGERNPAAAGRALEKLHRSIRSPAVMEDPSTHPDLWCRLTALGITPEWPKPEAVRYADWSEIRNCCWILALLTLGVMVAVFYAVR